MKKDFIVIGLHDKQLAAVEIQEVGLCLICKKPVYLAKQGVNGELAIHELKKLKLKRLMGMPCVLDIVAAFAKIMSASPSQKQDTINRLIKKERPL